MMDQLHVTQVKDRSQAAKSKAEIKILEVQEVALVKAANAL